jgi:hypothetical protein
VLVGEAGLGVFLIKWVEDRFAAFCCKLAAGKIEFGGGCCGRRIRQLGMKEGHHSLMAWLFLSLRFFF